MPPTTHTPNEKYIHAASARTAIAKHSVPRSARMGGWGGGVD
jgi:hypothetical protein